jgi:hypothetical protein
MLPKGSFSEPLRRYILWARVPLWNRSGRGLSPAGFWRGSSVRALAQLKDLCILFKGHATRRRNQRRVKTGVADGGIGDLFMRTFIGKRLVRMLEPGRGGIYSPQKRANQIRQFRRKNFLEGGSKIWRMVPFHDPAHLARGPWHLWGKGLTRSF